MWAHKEIWKKEFSIHPAITKKALTLKSKVLDDYCRNNNISPSRKITAVAVHVRRTDYRGQLKKYNVGDLLPPRYYFTAFQYFRER